jgi:hypothetical protein
MSVEERFTILGGVALALAVFGVPLALSAIIAAACAFGDFAVKMVIHI